MEEMVEIMEMEIFHTVAIQAAILDQIKDGQVGPPTQIIGQEGPQVIDPVVLPARPGGSSSYRPGGSSSYRPGGSSSSYRPSGSSSYRPSNSPSLSNILNGSIRNGNTGDKNKDKDAVVFSDA